MPDAVLNILHVWSPWILITIPEVDGYDFCFTEGNVNGEVHTGKPVVMDSGCCNKDWMA